VRELSELEACIKKGLIRKIQPSEENAKRSISKAKKWIEEAKIALGAKLFDSCLVASYVAMFHCARSLLIKDGFRERSHYCVVRYVEEKYASKGAVDNSVVDLLDRYRELRQEDVYDINFAATEEDAKEAVKNAEFILKQIEKLAP